MLALLAWSGRSQGIQGAEFGDLASVEIRGFDTLEIELSIVAIVPHSLKGLSPLGKFRDFHYRKLVSMLRICTPAKASAGKGVSH